MNSVCTTRNRVHCTRFPFAYVSTIAAHKKTLQKNTKNQVLHTKTVQKHTKKLSSKHTVLSLSFPLTFSHPHTLIPSRSVAVALPLTLIPSCSVAVTASCSRRRHCLSLLSLRLCLAQSFSLSGWLRLPHKSKDSLFFLGLLVMEACIVLDIWGVQSLLPYLIL